MKTILCFGDSNTWGARPLTSLNDITRYGPDVRWGSVLRGTLGEGFWVVEEGLNGRTTVWPDPVEGEYKSGKSYLPACLESHAPLDLAAIMLGTNDLNQETPVRVKIGDRMIAPTLPADSFNTIVVEG